MFDLLRNQYKVNERNINYAIPFDNIEKMTAADKFDILLYTYKKKYKSNALSQIISEYKLDEPKFEYDKKEKYTNNL